MEESVEDIYGRILDLSNSLQVFKANSPHRPPYGVNLFDKFQANEVDISWALNMIFNFAQYDKSTSSMNYPMLEKFIDKYVNPLRQADNHLQVKHPVIKKEWNHIDMLVCDKDYAIILENKINGAVYQRNQIGRYINTLLEKGYAKEQIYIFILPKDSSVSYLKNIRESAWKCPKDWNIPNSIRRCKIDEHSCWCDVNKTLTDEEKKHCEECSKFKPDLPQTIVLSSDFADWLEEVSNKEIPPRETILKSVIIQTADYIKGKFGTRLKEEFKMDIQNFIKNNLSLNEEPLDQFKEIRRHIEHLDELRKNLVAYAQYIIVCLFDRWIHELDDLAILDDLKYKDYKNGIAGLYIDKEKKIVCAFCDGRDNENYMPYWGIYLAEGTADKISNEMEEQIKNILVASEIDIKDLMNNKNVNNSPWYLWKPGFEGAQICNKVYEVAQAKQS